MGVVGEKLAGEILPAFCAAGIVLTEETNPPKAVVVKGVGVVIVDRLIGSVAKPTVAESHGFQGIEPFPDLRGVSFLAEALLFEKGEGEDAEEEVVVGVQLGSTD